MDILTDITARVKRYAGRAPSLTDKIGRDLRIDRGDFVEFCDEMEAAYGVDLRPLFEPTGTFKDATVAELAAYVSSQRISN